MALDIREAVKHVIGNCDNAALSYIIGPNSLSAMALPSPSISTR